MDGVGGTFERINNSNTSSMVQDFVAGLGDHPGFANIVSSMIQVVFAKAPIWDFGCIIRDQLGAKLVISIQSASEID